MNVGGVKFVFKVKIKLNLKLIQTKKQKKKFIFFFLQGLEFGWVCDQGLVGLTPLSQNQLRPVTSL